MLSSLKIQTPQHLPCSTRHGSRAGEGCLMYSECALTEAGARVSPFHVADVVRLKEVRLVEIALKVQVGGAVPHLHRPIRHLGHLDPL